MNQVATTKPTHLVALSAKLERAVAVAMEAPRRYSSPGDDAPLVIASSNFTPSSEVVEEARLALPGLEVALSPAPHALIRKWLERLNAGVRNPQDETSFNLRAESIAIVCSDQPAQCFTIETLKSALREFQFFPSAADLAAFCDKISAPLMRKLSAVRSFADGRPAFQETPRAPREQATQAEIDYVARILSAFKSERASRGARR